MARIIDTLVLILPASAAVGLGLGTGVGLGNAFSDAASDPPVVALVGGIVLGGALMAVVSYLYGVRYLCRHAGQTIGKRRRNIRVVRLDGQPLTARDARRRWLAYEGVSFTGIIPGVSFITSIYDWLDPLWCLWDQPYRQCLHDKFAHTVVVTVDRLS